jgi:hypothetical protein
MDTYKTTIDKESWLVLSTDAELFRYLQAPNATATARRSTGR